MHPDYIRKIEQARLQRKENKLFFEKLKKRKPSDLDRVTNELHDKAFEDIDCLKCANCCRTTGPLLRGKDIDQLAGYFKIRPAVFTEKYLRIDEDGDYVFKSMPCPFLGNDNYCSVYQQRPGACRDYPHTQQRDIRQKLNITLENTVICPAVAEVVEGLRRHYELK